MFAVPGWNLSAPIATQVEKANTKEPPEGKKSKKRKQKQQDQVDAGNVGEYWEKLIEGKDHKQDDQTQNVKETTQQAEAPEKTGKKRKRKGNKEHKEDGQNGTEAAANGDIQNNNSSTGVPKPVSDDATDSVSKREKKKRKKDSKSQSTDTIETAVKTDLAPLIPEPKGLTPLQRSMRAKLTSARFRHLNESLYTKPSKESLDLFKESPEMFEDYHRGFAQQVEVWPENPVDGYVNAILTRGKLRSKDPWKDKKRKDKKTKGGAAPEEINSTPNTSLKPLPRNFKGHATVADLGCGTASLSLRLQPSLKQLNLTMHSFDLSKPSGPSGPLVTVADISALPLPDGSVDVAIFCLALMGTNWLDFIDEAYRILRWRGELWVSEIKSRFGRVTKGKVPINSVGSLKKPDKKPKKGKKTDEKQEDEGIQGSEDEAELAERVDGAEGKEGTNVSAFVEALKKRGFMLDALPERQNDAVDLSNKMFVKMQFVKAAPPSKGKNVKREEAGKGNMRMGLKGKKFAAITPSEDPADDTADAKTLKPCLYKIR